MQGAPRVLVTSGHSHHSAWAAAGAIGEALAGRCWECVSLHAQRCKPRCVASSGARCVHGAVVHQAWVLCVARRMVPEAGQGAGRRGCF